jgi:anti-sigma factor RsiW
VSRSDGHVPDELLASFVDGDMDESVAVHVAEHLDACPACATRAATMEPLAAAFAAVPDPIAPKGLADAALARLEQPERTPSVEVMVGSVLLAAAAFLTILGGHPARSAVEIGRLADGFSRAAVHLSGGAISMIGVTLVLFVLGALLARSVRTLSPDRSTL